MYPTKEEILEKEVLFKISTLKTVREWRDKYYSDNQWNIQNRNDAIIILLNKLGESYSKPVEVMSEQGIKPYYDSNSKTIHVSSTNPSIISALHEFAHHILGPNEKKACRWSIWLFKKVFPETFEKLEFKGHLLKKKENEH